MIEELTQWLMDETSGWTVGTNLVSKSFDDTCADDCIMAREIGGTAETNASPLFTSFVEIVSRAKDERTAFQNLETFYDLCRIKGSATLPQVDGGKRFKINTFNVVSRPQRAGMDTRGDRHAFAFMMRLSAREI